MFRDTRIQIGILKSRGVVIKNTRRAKDIIRRTNYYNLINGYKDPFLQKGTSTEKYLPGTTLEEIYALYEFDRKLRILTLEYILEIEKQVKTIVSYCFSKEHGHKDFLKPDNFDTYGKNKYSKVCSLISRVYKNISDNIQKEPSVEHYVNGKNYVPLWVIVNTMSIGEISKFYSSMLQKERAEVAKRIKYGVKENSLESYLFFLSSIRNRCAHDERLFSYLSYVEIPKNNYFNYYNYYNVHKPAKNYFALITVFKVLLPKYRYNEYHDSLESLLNKLSNQLKVISINDILKMMGMPKNWRKIKELNLSI